MSTFFFFFCCHWLLLRHVADSYLLIWTGGRTGDSDSLLCSLTSFSQAPDYMVQSQQITDNKKWMTYTLHSQKEIYLRKEERKGLDKKVQVNLVWICLVCTTFLFLYASVHVRCNAYRLQQIKGIGNEVTIDTYS